MSSSELKPIVLYDIPCITPGLPWSPNTMKTRYCLGYKGLPFKTVWVELPDIAELLQSKGIKNPPYTLPAIEDPNTGAIVMDSLVIGTYLDETYPGTPKVLTPAARAIVEEVEGVLSFGSRGSGGAAAAATAALNTGASAGAGALVEGKTDGIRVELPPRLVFVVLGAERLNPVSNAWYHQTRTVRVGEQWTTLAKACSASPEFRTEHVKQGIEAFRDAWRKMTVICVRQSGSGQGISGGPFVLGEEPCFLDFAVAARVKYVLDGLAPSEVETLKSLEGGRLWKLVEELERYFKY